MQPFDPLERADPEISRKGAKAQRRIIHHREHRDRREKLITSRGSIKSLTFYPLDYAMTIIY
jgi:hypothetical protein